MIYSENGKALFQLALDKGLTTMYELAMFIKTNHANDSIKKIIGGCHVG